ncbi:MAG TPA: hypothetical protein VK897_16535 [Anaerolineales bacterium]|nr:hypothetical protein [Anaerolineales bacterium]
MIPQDQPRLRRFILIGTPLLTGILLLFHPLPEAAEMEHTGLPQGLALYELMAPIAEGFLIVHLLFPLALALLGLSVVLLLDGVQGIAAIVSRVCAFVFTISYIVYETIIGTVTGLLIRDAAALSPADQAVIGDVIYRNYTDPALGDLPSVVSLTAWLSWLLAVTLAAFALRRSGKPLGACILLGLSFIFISHASMLGPLGMLFFLFSAVGIERAGSAVRTGRYETFPSS